MDVVEQLEKTLHGNILITERKRRFEDYSQVYDVKCCLTDSTYIRKKLQIRKITTEAHEHTLSLMMNAAKELYIREKNLKQNIDMDNKDIICNSCGQNQQEDQQEPYHNRYQKPFW